MMPMLPVGESRSRLKVALRGRFVEWKSSIDCFVGYLLLTLTVGIVACGSGGSRMGGNTIINIAGNWSGTISDTDINPPGQGTATLSLSQDSSGNLSGTFSFTAPTCLVQNLPLTGTLQGKTVSLSSNSQLAPVTIQLTVDSLSQHLAGSYQAEEPALCGSSGAISLSKM
jgi:hypothetical protein